MGTERRRRPPLSEVKDVNVLPVLAGKEAAAAIAPKQHSTFFEPFRKPQGQT